MFGLVILLAIAAGGMFLFQWLFGPRRMKDGRYRIKDHSDGLFAGLASFVVLLAIIALNVVVINAALLSQMELKPMLVGGAIMLAVDALAVFVCGTKIREVLRAAPGELIAPEWPLPSGEPVKLLFTRRLRSDEALKTVGGELVHYHTHKDNDSNNSHRHAVERVSATCKRSRVKNGVVQASFTLVTPERMDVKRMLFAMFFDRHSGGTHEWVFQVNVWTELGAPLDSSFKIDFGASGDQLRLSA